MVMRRQAREWAVMMLCECDLNPPESLERALKAFWEQQADLERDRLEANEYGVKKAFCAQRSYSISRLNFAVMFGWVARNRMRSAVE